MAAERTRALGGDAPPAWVPAGGCCVTLGSAGFGRSDSRAHPREFFEGSPRHIVLRALQALADDGTVDAALPVQTRQRYGISADPHPWTV